MNTFNRNGAFSCNLKEIVGDDVVCMIPTKDFMEFLHKNKISRMVLPETKDPDNKNPNLKPEIYVHNEHAGAKNAIVVRLSYQVNELLQIFYNGQEDLEIRENIITHIAEARDELLEAENISNSIINDIEKLNQENSKIDTNQTNLVTVKKIDNLEKRVKHYLSCLKGFCKNLIKIANPIFGTDFESPWFHKLEQHLTEKYGPEDELAQFLRSENCKGFLEMIIGMRNATEHKSKTGEIFIKNYEYEADGIVYEPQWLFLYSRENKLAFKRQGLLREDLSSLIKEVLSFAEDFYSLCLTYKITTKEGLFQHMTISIEKIEEKNVDPELPVKIKWHLEPLPESALMKGLMDQMKNN
jgi:hypothetical protein